MLGGLGRVSDDASVLVDPLEGVGDLADCLLVRCCVFESLFWSSCGSSCGNSGRRLVEAEDEISVTARCDRCGDAADRHARVAIGERVPVSIRVAWRIAAVSFLRVDCRPARAQIAMSSFTP